ncbi:MAG TPA: threonine synthase, partial [bacterium]|nr:threonine synthase [bacterium]
MRFLSTRGSCDPASFRAALFRGLAPDGGLYLPERVPELPASRLASFAGATLAEIGAAVAAEFVDDLPPDTLAGVCADALDFPVPLVALDDRVFLLELFHGPTLAFKDVGARFMARAMGAYLGERRESLTILVATSGDTGGAVAQAFHGVPGTSVVVLYPAGRVSPVQERQFTTLGGNVRAYAVDGAFDDCQRMVKAAFRNETLSEGLRLTSANSINVGRLVPQTFYYFHAAARWPHDDPPVVCTPSGNFGNLCAGLLARRMGLPVSAFVAATNANDVVPEYLDTGDFRLRPSLSTLSNAMDVGDPSNFDRILHLYGGSHRAIAVDVRGSRHDDDATRAEIR